MAVLRVIPAGDIALVAGSTTMIEGPPAIRQKLSTRYQFFLAEWFLDLRQGVPYYRDVFLKDPNIDVIRSLFRKLTIETPGVLSVPRYRALFNESARTLAFDFAAKVTGGELVIAPTDRDFLLDLAG
jgi:hypothetical protein